MAATMHKRTPTQGPLYGTEVTLTRQVREQRPRTISNPYARIGRRRSCDPQAAAGLADRGTTPEDTLKRCTYAHGRQRDARRGIFLGYLKYTGTVSRRVIVGRGLIARRPRGAACMGLDTRRTIDRNAPVFFSLTFPTPKWPSPDRVGGKFVLAA